MNCPHCGVLLAIDAKFCQNCGKSVPPTPTGVHLHGNAFDVSGGTVNIGVSPNSISPTGDHCPICGAYNLASNTFRCASCERPFICLKHQDRETFLCADCYEKAKPDLAEKLFSQGIVFRDEGDNTRAIEIFTKAISMNSNNADFYVARACEYFSIGDTAREIADLKRALDISPRNEGTYLLLVQTYSRVGDYQNVINLALTANLMFPKSQSDDWTLYDIHLAEAYGKLGDSEMAQQYRNRLFGKYFP